MAQDGPTTRLAAGRARCSRWSRWWPFAVLASCTLIALPTLVAFWSNTIMATIDVQEYFVWLNLFARDQWRSGSVPLWNPYVYGGMPFAANPQASVFYPLAWIACLLPVVSAQKLLVVVHVLLAGVFTFGYLRTIGVTRVAAVVGALPYMLGGFLMTNVAVGHLTMLFTAAWLPLVLTMWERFHRTGKARWAGAAGLVLALQITAGEPQCSYYTALLLTLYGLIRAGIDDRALGGGGAGRRFLLAGAGVLIVAVVSAAASAVQIVPTAEMALHSDRSAGSFEFATTASMRPKAWLGLVMPWSELATHGLAIQSFKWAVPQSWEWAFYPGLITLVLAVFSLRTRREPIVVIARVVAVLAAIMMMGKFTPLYAVLLKVFPGLVLFRIPSRAAILLVWALSVMAAFGADRLLRSRDGASADERSGAPGALQMGWWRYVAGALLVALLGGVITLTTALDVRPVVFGIGEVPMTIGHPIAVSMIISIAVTLAFVIAVRWLPRPVAAGALILVLAVDLVSSRPALPLEPFDAAADPSVTFLNSIRDQLQDGVLPYRVDTSRHVHYSNAAMVARVELVNGYMPLSLDRFFTFVHRMRGLEVPAEHRSYIDDEVYKTSDVFPLRVMNVRVGSQWTGDKYGFVLHADAIPRAWIVHRAETLTDEASILARLGDPGFEPRQTVLLERAPRITMPGDGTNRCEVTRVDAGHLRLITSADRDGYLVLSEMFYPGWEAFIDGVPVETERADYLITALPLPAGEHTVDYRYRPTSFRLGAGLTAVTLLGAGGGASVLGLAARRRRRRADAKQTTETPE